MSVFGMVENIVGKGENAGYQHFLLFPQKDLVLSHFRNKLESGGKELTHDFYQP